MPEIISRLNDEEIADYFYEGASFIDPHALYDLIAQDNGDILIHKSLPSAEEATEIARNYVLEKLNQAKKEKFIVWNSHNSIRTCTIYTDRKASMGYAKCRPGDKNIPEIGKALAYSRASGEPLPKLLRAYLNID